MANRAKQLDVLTDLARIRHTLPVLLDDRALALIGGLCVPCVDGLLGLGLDERLVVALLGKQPACVRIGEQHLGDS
jgi:hypothetical protein